MSAGTDKAADAVLSAQVRIGSGFGSLFGAGAEIHGDWLALRREDGPVMRKHALDRCDRSIAEARRIVDDIQAELLYAAAAITTERALAKARAS